MFGKFLRIIGVISILLAVLCTAYVVKNSNQAFMAVPMEVTFTGEYSYDGEKWHPYTEKSQVSALKGDIVFRGNFKEEIFEGSVFNFYCNHIGMSMYINGELVFIDSLTELKNTGADIVPSLCGKVWQQFLVPAIATNDQVEIHFTNIHKHGNKHAYQEAMADIFIGPDDNKILPNYLGEYIKPVKTIGYALLIVSFLLLGATVCACAVKFEGISKLAIMWLITVFAAGYVLSDIMTMSIIVETITLKTYSRQLCMMLGLFFVQLGASKILSGKTKKMTDILLGASGLLNVVIIAIATIGKMLIFDTQFIWLVSQVIMCGAFICIGVYEIKKNNSQKIELGAYIIIFATVILDIAGVAYHTYYPGVCTKIAIVIIMIVSLLRVSKHIFIDYNAAIENRILQKEMEDNRITVMMSQIQPHFLYNSLTSVMDLCDREPKQAKKAIADFADYLRGNLESLNSKELIPFQRELAHIERYLRLEKLRFQEDLQVVYDIQATDFMLPALCIQPLVENAVKHGLGNMVGGGTVTISTKETESHYVIQISDNGRGFSDEEIVKDGNTHIGIENIRWRLKVMMEARLEINSKHGEGTIAYVFIPKEGAK